MDSRWTDDARHLRIPLTEGRCPDGRWVKDIPLLDMASDTAVARGDGLAVLVLIGLMVFVVALMGAIASDKRRTFKTGDKAPREGEYVAEAHAFHGAGRTIAPPSGERWRLEEAYISWLLPCPSANMGLSTAPGTTRPTCPIGLVATQITGSASS
jgi:hypothetical protein